MSRGEDCFDVVEGSVYGEGRGGCIYMDDPGMMVRYGGAESFLEVGGKGANMCVFLCEDGRSLWSANERLSRGVNTVKRCVNVALRSAILTDR